MKTSEKRPNNRLLKPAGVILDTFRDFKALRDPIATPNPDSFNTDMLSYLRVRNPKTGKLLGVPAVTSNDVAAFTTVNMPHRSFKYSTKAWSMLVEVLQTAEALRPNYFKHPMHLLVTDSTDETMTGIRSEIMRPLSLELDAGRLAIWGIAEAGNDVLISYGRALQKPPLPRLPVAERNI